MTENQYSEISHRRPVRGEREAGSGEGAKGDGVERYPDRLCSLTTEAIDMTFSDAFPHVAEGKGKGPWPLQGSVCHSPTPFSGVTPSTRDDSARSRRRGNSMQIAANKILNPCILLYFAVEAAAGNYTIYTPPPPPAPIQTRR